MQGRNLFLDKEVVRFRLSERVRPHNLYRRLAELVDWLFVYDVTRALYSHTAQPSLNPVVFFKLVLVGRLENLVSDRRLVEHCALRLDILVKRQQMQWTKKGAHLLVQARTQVLNEDWEACFRQQCHGFQPLPAEPILMAA